jgi:hypothetical protein
MEKHGRRRIRVVLVPAPFQGHINPMLQLGSILHSNGFSITVVHAQYNSPKPSSHPDFSFLSLPDTSTDHKILSDELVPFVSQLNAKCKDRFRECLAGVMRQQGETDDAIACVIYDEAMYFSEETAKDLNLPSIILRTGSASHFLARTALVQLIKTEGHIPFPGTILLMKSQKCLVKFIFFKTFSSLKSHGIINTPIEQNLNIFKHIGINTSILNLSLVHNSFSHAGGHGMSESGPPD